MKIPLKCPQCGGQKFKRAPALRGTDDLKGTVCADCGRELSENDIRTQAKTFTDDLARKRRPETA
ncbi:MAG TPA: hypothetical protein VMI94_25645 [Bryobacteraceae bacterium]|nr:hypothetical protein [Bryobacteraceae bacterium]